MWPPGFPGLPHIAAALAVLSITMAVCAQPTKPPFSYVWGKAYHVLPETHNNESGYFSLSEGTDGKIYVGTAKYGVNSYLVELDPKTEKQRVVLDTHKTCGVTAAGFAAQAKIHTPNFVGPSGTVYLGSKPGYPEKGDTQEYPGGYVMTYDPKTGKAECLGMPSKGYGVGDVVADEGRGLLYVVAEAVKPTAPMRWIRYDLRKKEYRELGPRPTPYATTLLDGKGRAHTVVEGEFRIATYDPAADKVTQRPVEVEGSRKFGKVAIPTWQVAADGRTAYLIQMSDPTLIEIDLYSGGEALKARTRGKMIAGKNADSRQGLGIAPDGRVYAVVRVDNETKFGAGHLHHLTRYDPKTKKVEDLGVLAVKNPDYFDFRPRSDGNPPPFSHGFHKLADGTLTPLHHHMALVVGRNGTVYVTIIYPFTLLRIGPPEP